MNNPIIVSNKTFREILQLGQASLDRQEFDLSESYYYQAIKLTPTSALPYRGLGDVFNKRKKTEKAIAAYEKAISLNPEYWHTYQRLGAIYQKQGNYRQAILAYRRALNIAPTQTKIQQKLDSLHPEDFLEECLNKARQAVKEGNLQEAIAEYQLAVAIEPNFVEGYLQLGNLLAELENYREAINSYQQALEIEPDAKTYHLLATPLEKLERWLELINVYIKAIEQNPNYYLYYHQLGDVYYKLNKNTAAIDAYHRAIELYCSYFWLHYHLGITWQGEGKLKAAIKCYQTALALQPNLEPISSSLKNALNKQKKDYKKIIITDQQAPRDRPKLANNTGLKIIFYPRFTERDSYTDHFYRMIWYLNPLIEQIATITIPLAFEDINPDFCPAYLDDKVVDLYERFANKISFNFSNRVDDYISDIKEANFVLRWNVETTTNSVNKDPGLDLLKTKKNWRIDHDRERYAGSFYLKCGVENDGEYEKNLAESQEKFHDLAQYLQNDRGFIFGTGPSLSQAYNFRFDNAEVIACNSMLKNRTLMEYLSPKLIVAADPIFHAGCSAYAADFRKYLCDALEYFQSYFIVPMRDIHIYKHNLPSELVHRIIGIPLETAEQPNLNLLERFQVTSTSNVLTLYLVPLATTLFKQIGIIGCDGRPLHENDYFWKHDPSSQFVNKMSVIQEAHGAFFEIDYDEYYLTHCDILQKWLVAAENAGKEICNLTPSYIQALQDRTFALNENSTLPNWIEFNGTRASGEPLASIIMPARNAATTIATSIKTIQDEPLQEWEIIVINDGSSDETAEVVEQIRKSDPRVAIYHTCGRGVAFARNVGLSVARGKYIGFLDADDLYQNQAMTKRVRALEDNPHWEGVYCLTEIVDGNLEELNWSIGSYRRKISFADMHSNIHLGSVIAKADLLRRQSFQVGLANGEDWLYLSQVLRAGTELEYIPDCHVAYRIHDRSTVLQDFAAHENKLLEIIEILYGSDPNCTEPTEQYRFGLIQTPDKQLVILKRRINLLTFLLLSRKARNFYQVIQTTKNLPWDNLDENIILGNIRSTTMRYYSCSIKIWQEKFQQNSTYIQQVIAELKLAKIIPKFHKLLLELCN
jgi:tetratricopeptide (TPR) repeat protein